MKKTLYTILSALVIGACSLSEESYTNVDKESYLNNANDAETLLMGVYHEMCTEGIYRLNLSMLLALPTDEAKVEGSTIVGPREQASNAYTSTDSYVQNTWATLYEAIYTANSFLESIEEKSGDFTEADKEKCKLYVAEARALRALYYFELVRWFGNVPLVTKTEESYKKATEFVQASPVDVYKFIEEDLLFAAETLPWATDDAVRSDNSFRFSKGGALGLLAKVYATWAGYPLNDTSKWEKAAEAAGKVVKSGKHSLLPSYEQLWKNAANNVWAPQESLIEASFYAPQSNAASSGRVGKWNGVNAVQGSIKGNYNSSMYKVHPTFLAKWRSSWKEGATDLRWGLSFADYKYTLDGKVAITTSNINGKSTYITFQMAMDNTMEGWKADWRKNFCYQIPPAKWDIEKYVDDANQIADNNYSNVNWYVLRYADVLLLYAEALNEANGGPTSDAYRAINQVRRRGYGADVDHYSAGADLDRGMDQEEFRQAIRDERSYELAFEGHRRQDLVRWGIYAKAIKETYESLMDWHEQAPNYFMGASFTIEGKNELLPIPQHDVDLSGFKQNPKW